MDGIKMFCHIMPKWSIIYIYIKFQPYVLRYNYISSYFLLQLSRYRWSATLIRKDDCQMAPVWAVRGELIDVASLAHCFVFFPGVARVFHSVTSIAWNMRICGIFYLQFIEIMWDPYVEIIELALYSSLLTSKEQDLILSFS